MGGHGVTGGSWGHWWGYGVTGGSWGHRGAYRVTPTTPPQVVELRFGKFDVEADAHCRYDYVAVFDGARSDDARRLGRFCGDTAPG